MASRALTTGQGWATFAAAELQAYPGRWNVTLRCLLASALTIVGSLTFGVPLLPVSLFLVFFAVQSNVVLTQLVSAVIFIGLLIAVALLVLLLMFTLQRPLLRLLAISFLMLGVMWLMRATTIGPMFYLIGLAISCAQPYLDLPLPPELFVRAILWAFMAAFYPLMLCLIINSVLLPGEPLRQLKDEAHRQLGDLDTLLLHVLNADAPVPPRLDAVDVQAGMLGARKLLRFAWMRSKALRQKKGRHLALAATITALREQALLLQEPAGLAAARAHPDNVRALQQALRTLDHAIETEGRFDRSGIAWPQAATGTLLDTCWHSLQLLADSSGQSPQAPAEPRQQLLAADALSNPVYWQYALKTLLAMALGYTFLLATDWTGIATVVVTCLIVAQPSLGASNRKIQLRVLGAAIGSAIALLEIVFLMPHVDGIVGLLLLTVPVLGAAAYLSAGSERVAYLGQQLMFTYALATLLSFGPTTNLTEIRNRLIGIFIGIGISYVIHTLLWPERESAPLALQIAAAVRAVAALVAPVPPSADTAAAEDAWSTLNAAQDTITRIAVEPHWGQAEGEHEATVQRMQVVVGNAREVLLAAAALQATLRAAPADAATQPALAQIQDAVAHTLHDFAAGMAAARDVFYSAPPAPDQTPDAAWARVHTHISAPPLQQALRRLVRASGYLVRARRAPAVNPQRVVVVAEGLA